MEEKDDERKDVDEGNRPVELSDEQLEGISGGKGGSHEISIVKNVDKASSSLG